MHNIFVHFCRFKGAFLLDGCVPESYRRRICRRWFHRPENLHHNIACSKQQVKTVRKSAPRASSFRLSPSHRLHPTPFTDTKSVVNVTQELKLIFPTSSRINRGNTKVPEVSARRCGAPCLRRRQFPHHILLHGQLVEACRTNNFTDIIVIQEHRGTPGPHHHCMLACMSVTVLLIGMHCDCTFDWHMQPGSLSAISRTGPLHILQSQMWSHGMTSKIE